MNSNSIYIITDRIGVYLDAFVLLHIPSEHTGMCTHVSRWYILYSETLGRRFSELYMIIQIPVAFSEFCMIKILLEVPIQEDMVVHPLPQPVSIMLKASVCPTVGWVQEQLRHHLKELAGTHMWILRSNLFFFFN